MRRICNWFPPEKYIFLYNLFFSIQLLQYHVANEDRRRSPIQTLNFQLVYNYYFFFSIFVSRIQLLQYHVADEDGLGPIARSVEQCVCGEAYTGLSCQVYTMYGSRTESPADKIPGGQNPSRTKSPRFGQLGQNPHDILTGWTKSPHLISLNFQQLLLFLRIGYIINIKL